MTVHTVNSTPETTVAPDINTSLGVVWTFPEGSGGSEDGEVEIRPADDSDGVMWVYVLWVVGVCLLITIIVLSVYSLRHRMPFMPKKSKESVSSACSCSSAIIRKGKASTSVNYFPPCETYRS